MRESENCMSIKTKLMTACAGVLLMGGIGASVASAALKIDIRDANGGKEVMLTAADLGKPITLNIFAQVTGGPTNAGKESLSTIRGAVVTTGTTPCNTAPAFYRLDPDTGDPTVGPFTPWGDPDNDKYSMGGNGSQNGVAKDIDGDGDIDLGGKPGDPTAEWIILRSNKNFQVWATGGQGTKILQNDGTWKGDVEFLVAQVNVTPVALAGNTLVDWKFAMNAAGALTKETALWTEDGSASENLRDGFSGVLASSGYTLIVPEPASLSMLGLGAAMLLGRRNRK